MTSHGVPRLAKVTKSEQAIQREREDISKYKSLVDEINDAIDKNDFSRRTLDFTTKLLKQNPEEYTTWNHRRRCLLSLSEAEPEDIQTLLLNDLTFLLPLLITYPKCYWIWNHRGWVLRKISERSSPEVVRATWQNEIGLVGKMLTRDSRNFHGWSYRRLIIAELRKLDATTTAIAVTESLPEGSASPLTEQEFEYTTKMLRSNLSNFSAWHNRSKLIPRLLDERRSNAEDRRKLFDDELKKVNEALSIDPYDQSLWFYHQYLITQITSRSQTCFGAFTDAQRADYLRTEIDVFGELLEDFDDCKWILQNLIEHTVLLRALDVESQTAQADVLQWLERLRQLDSLRKGRWDDLERLLSTT